MASGNGTGSPCGACKFLRRKCAADCIFAPYFCSEQGPSRFAAIHKVFGASNVSKLLLHVPVADRCEAVVTIAYEAQARLRDPVYGCVAHIFALQQQVAYLQAQLMQARAQLGQSMSESRNMNLENQWIGGINVNGSSINFNNIPISSTFLTNMNPISPQSSLESIEQSNEGMNMQELMMHSREDHFTSLINHHHQQQQQQQACSNKKRPNNTTDLGELQALALRMMRN